VSDVHVVYPLVVSALLFGIGLYGVLARRHAILILMSVELMLNAANVSLVAFNLMLDDPLLTGQSLAVFVITIAAAEIGLGLAVVLLVFRRRATVGVDELIVLGEADRASATVADQHPEAAS
jgi:NADH-quinone oxidoreductase subunit K